MDSYRYEADRWRVRALGNDRDAGWDPAAGEAVMEIDRCDWSHCRSLAFDLVSTEQSGARIELAIEGVRVDGTEATVGSIIFAVDWSGPNTMRLWLGTISASGRPDELTAVTRIRLTRKSTGMKPARLRLGAVEVTASAPSWVVNESDTVIDAGWSHAAARAEEWHFHDSATSTPGEAPYVLSPQPMAVIDGREAVGNERRQRAAWYKFGYRQGETPGRIRVERRFDLDVTLQREILAKLVWDRDLVVTVTAIVETGDPARPVEIDLVRDGNHPVDFNFLTIGASLSGARKLVSLRIDAKETDGRTLDHREIMVSLFWILLRRAGVLDAEPVEEVEIRLAPTHHPYPESVPTTRRLVRRVPFREPAPSSSPIGDPLVDGLPFGFLVRRDELTALRERCRSGTAAAIFRAIREEADRAIATEAVDRNYYGSAYGGGVGQLKGVRGAGMRVFAPLTALAHLVTGEAKYAVACRRWILRSAESDDWRGDHGGCVDRPQIGDLLPYWDSFTGWFPLGFAGYMNHPFQVADPAFGIVVAYDMIYHCFSDTEREAVEAAFARVGTYILADKLRTNREYYVKMNQGILFALPLLMETAFLARRDPIYRELHRWTLEFMEEYIESPWSAEGVCGEGPGYGIGTLAEVIEALPIIAACRRVPVEAVIPKSIRKVMTYIEHVRSTWSNDAWEGRPHFLGLSDGSEYNWAGASVFAFFANHQGDPVAQYFWNESYSTAAPQDLTTLLSLGEGTAPAEPALPPAHVYRDQPMVFFRTGWRPGSTLLCVNAIRQVTCHGHKDRGSLIFEYGGEALVLDPGMIGYSDPASDQYHETFCHSTITFSQQSQSGGTTEYDTSIVDFISTSGEACPGDLDGIDWAIVDIGAVYPQASLVRRHVIFLRPRICVLYDEVEADRDERIEVNFTSLPRLSVDRGGGYSGATARNTLRLWTISNRPLESAVSNWGTHWPEIPAYRLVTGTAGRFHKARFLTILAGGSPGVESLEISQVDSPGLLGFAARTGDREATILVSESPGIVTEDIETNGLGIVIRRRGGRIAGAVTLDAEGVRSKGVPMREADGRRQGALRSWR